MQRQTTLFAASLHTWVFCLVCLCVCAAGFCSCSSSSSQLIAASWGTGLWDLLGPRKVPRILCKPVNYTLSCLQMDTLPLVHWKKHEIQLVRRGRGFKVHLWIKKKKKSPTDLFAWPVSSRSRGWGNYTSALTQSPATEDCSDCRHTLDMLFFWEKFECQQIFIKYIRVLLIEHGTSETFPIINQLPWRQQKEHHEFTF